MASDGLRHQVFLKEEQQQQLEIAREIALIREITEQLRDAISRSDVTALESAIAGALQVPSACRSRRRDASAHHGAPCLPSPQVQLQDDLVGEAQQLLSLLQVSDVNCLGLPLIAPFITPGTCQAGPSPSPQACKCSPRRLAPFSPQARAKATAALQSAIDARDLPALEIALAMALKISFVDELVQRAQHLASQLVEQQKATRALADALQSNELDSLKAALAAAVRLIATDDL